MALEITRHPSLSECTSLGLGGTAEAKAVVRDKADLDELTYFLSVEPLRPFVIGEGTNLLVSDENLDLLLIHPDTPSGPQRIEKEGNTLIVRCGAGQRLPGLLGWSQMAGLSGLEPLAGIPGSVGGAVAMNAGSYGAEFGQFLRRIHIWSPSQGLQWVDAGQCEFGYRHFSCPEIGGKFLVWEVELALAESTPKAVRTGIKDTYARKRATQPVTARSAGCVFKNPPDKSAGQLLDQAGLKGASCGDMAFSDIHANFLVNLGNGTSAQALELIKEAQRTVKEQFDIDLELEVIVL